MSDKLPDFSDIVSTPAFPEISPAPSSFQQLQQGQSERAVQVPSTVEQMFDENEDPDRTPAPPIADERDNTQFRSTPDPVVPEIRPGPTVWDVGNWHNQIGGYLREIDKAASKGAASQVVTTGLGLGASMAELEQNLPQAGVEKGLVNILDHAIAEKDPVLRQKNMDNIRASLPQLFPNRVDRESAQRLISDAFEDPEAFKVLKDQVGKQWDPFEDNGFKALFATQKWIDDTFKPSPDFANTWSDKLAQGGGSLLTFVAATYFGGSVTGFSTGALSGQGEAFQRALLAGAPPELALKAAMLGTIPGLTENVPIELLLKNPKMTSVLFALAAKAGTQAIAEGGQEALQTYMQNAIAKYVYKPDQVLSEGTGEAAILGGVLGAGASGAVQLFDLRSRYYDRDTIRRLNEEWERQKAAGATTFDPGPTPPWAVGTPADPNANPLPPSVRGQLQPEPQPGAPKEGAEEKAAPGAPQAQETTVQPQPVAPAAGQEGETEPAKPVPKLSDVAPGEGIVPPPDRDKLLVELQGQFFADGEPPAMSPAAQAVYDALPADLRGILHKEAQAELAESEATDLLDDEQLAAVGGRDRDPRWNEAMHRLQLELARAAGEERVAKILEQTAPAPAIETPEFKAWFGTSKVVDDTGAPRVMYHGTRSDIRTFELSKGGEFGPGIYLSARPDTADFYASSVARGPEGPSLMPVFVNLRKPYRVNKVDWIKMTERKTPRTVQAELKAQGYDGIIGVGLTGDEQVIAFEPTQVKSVFNQGTFDPRNPDISRLSVPLRTGDETLEEFGIDPMDRPKVREVAAALEARQRQKFGQISFDDHSNAARDKLADWLATEVQFELHPGNVDKSAVGWYTDKFQRALDTFGTKYPELVDEQIPGDVRGRIYSRQDARDLLTALFAITSDGQRVMDNFRSADRVYAFYRENGAMPAAVEGGRGDRAASMVSNLAKIQALIDERGIEGMTRYLLTERTVAEVNADLRKLGRGAEIQSKLPASAVMPMSAIEFGPKLGAFYANLMGTQGYLTMDMWWTRTFNRLRGTLLTKPSEAGLKRVGAMVQQQRGLKKPPGRAQLLKIITDEAERYKSKGYKDGTELEKASNTIYKDAFVSLEEQPLGASDRAFMIATAKRAQELLRDRGFDLTIADIQALIWYYEKRLYGELGAKQSDDISYEEAARAAVAAREDLRQPGSADGGPGATVSGGARAAGTQPGQPGGRTRPQTAPRAVPADAADLTRLPGLPPRSPGPIRRIVAAAKRYAEISGVPFRRQLEHVTADADRGARIASAYEAMPHAPQDPEVKKAYRAMIDETLAQYQVVKEMGLRVEVIEPGMPNPYPDGPRQVLEDLQMNHLWLFPTDSGFGSLTSIEDNPLLEPTTEKIGDRVLLANDVFRIVHDVFGHGKEGVGFGASGEENAWQSHVRMYAYLAARAMTSETRGQNSWVNFGPYGSSNRSNQRETVYADQKTGLMPEWTMLEGVADDVTTPAPPEISAQTKVDDEVTAPDAPLYIVDRQTGAIVGQYKWKDRTRARRRVDKLDNEYGGYRYYSTLTPPAPVMKTLAPVPQAPPGAQKGEKIRPKKGIPAPATAREATMSKHDIFKAFAEALKLTVEQGRFGRGNSDAAAIYKWGQSVARIRQQGQLTELFHEGGHHVHAMMAALIDPVIAQHEAEIHNIAMKMYGGGGQIAARNVQELHYEGFATWFTLWMNNPAAAIAAAPGFTPAFEAMFNSKAPELAGTLTMIREQTRELLEEKPSIEVTRDRLVPLRKDTTISRIRESIADGNFLHDVGTLANRIYQGTFDQNHSLTVAVRRLHKIAEANVRRLMEQGVLDRVGAAKVLEALDRRGRRHPIKMLVLAKNSYNAATEMLATGATDWNGDGSPTSLGIPAILAIAQGSATKRLDPVVYDDFNLYLSARRMVQEYDNYNETRKWHAAKQRGVKYPEPRTKRYKSPDDVSQSDWVQTLTELHQKYPQFDRAAQELYKYQTAILKWRRDAGDIDDALFNYLAGMQNYVPIRRDMGDERLGSAFTGQGGGKDTRTGKDMGIKAFRGSQRRFMSPLESVMQATFEQVALTMNNQVKRAFVDLALDVGQNSGAIVEQIPATQMKGTQVRLADVLKAAPEVELAEEIANAMGRDEITLEEFMDEVLDGDEVATLWRSQDANERGEKIIYVHRGGKREAYKLNDQEWADDLYQTFTELGREQTNLLVRILAKPATYLRAGVTTSPPFMIANIIRDQIGAWILNDGVFPGLALARGIKGDLFDRKSRRIYNLSGAAIGGSNIAALDKTRFGTEQTRLAKLGIGVTAEATLTGALRLIDSSETWSRQGIFAAAFKKAKADGLTDGDAMAEAGFEASDYANYGRAGSKMLIARRLVTFLNANLQGLDKSIRVASGAEGGTAAFRKIVAPAVRRMLGSSGPRTSLPLTPQEKQQLQKGVRTLSKMMSLALVSALLAVMNWDDEEYDMMSPYLKGTRWMVKLAPGKWLAIPKPFQLAVFATGTEYAIDGILKDDPTALANFIKSQAAVLAPPYENPAIRLFYETATNTNLFTGRPIVNPELAGMPGWLQYDQYTSELGKAIGKVTGASPQLVDHYITASFATWGRGALSLSNFTNPARPSQGWDDLAFTSYFLKNGARSSTVRPAFWNLMAQRSGELTGIASGFKKLMDAGAEGQAKDFLGNVTEEQSVFAQLNYWQKVDGKRMHPLRNASDASNIISTMRKEITLSQLKTDKGKGELLVLSPTQQKLLNDRLSDLAVREMRNAMVVMEEPGFGQRKILPTLPIFEQIKQLDPRVATELKKRMLGQVYAFDAVRQQWPRVRSEVLTNGKDANLRPMINSAKAYGTKFFTMEGAAQ